MAATIITTGRTDLDAYFAKGDIHLDKWDHTPVLVFLSGADGENVVTVTLVHNEAELLDYPDDTPCMSQWRGKYRSDFFKFTVGDFRAFLRKDRERLAKLGVRFLKDI